MFFALAWKEAILKKKKSIIIKYAHTRQTVSQKHQDLKSIPSNHRPTESFPSCNIRVYPLVFNPLLATPTLLPALEIQSYPTSFCSF